MGYIVAIAAFRKLRHNAGRMRRTVAVLARRHHPVLLLMTECAFEGPVFGTAGTEEAGSLLVAQSAVFGGDVRSIGNRLRHMWVVAFVTAGGDFFRMGIVALGALRDHAVDTVAGGTSEAAVLADVVPELPGLQNMTVETSPVVERNFQWRMRVPVTPKTVLKFKMTSPGLKMTFIALLDRFLHFGRMTQVTAHTGDVSVFGPFRRYIIHRARMAFHAVLFFIVSIHLSGRRTRRRQKCRTAHDQKKYNRKNTGFCCFHISLQIITEPPHSSYDKPPRIQRSRI